MSDYFLNVINHELKRLIGYINYLADFEHDYIEHLYKLMKKYNLSEEEIIKNKKETFEDFKLYENYKKAKSLKENLKRIGERYIQGYDVKYDIQRFNNEYKSAHLTVPKSVTNEITETRYVKKVKPNVSQNNATPTLKGQVTKTDKNTDKEVFEKKVKVWEKRIKKTRFVGVGKLIASIGGWLNNNYSLAPDAAGMLNIAAGKNLPVYTKDAIKIDNIGDYRLDEFNGGDLSKWKSDMAKKINRQFKDFNYKAEDVKGYIFKSNSDVVKRIKESEDFKRILIKNKEKILKGNNFTGEFINDKNLYSAFHYVDFFNGGFDDKRNLHLYMFDTYDFNEGENPLVEAGRRQMMKGKLKGFFSVCEIVVTNEELKNYGFYK